MDLAELEIGLHRRDAETFTVELRYTAPKSDGESRLASGAPPVARFDAEVLRQLGNDIPGYGRALTESLFADVKVRQALSKARAAAASSDAVLRLRLLIGPSAPQLHGVCWEALRDPEDDSLLFTGEQTL